MSKETPTPTELEKCHHVVELRECDLEAPRAGLDYGRPGGDLTIADVFRE